MRRFLTLALALLLTGCANIASLLATPEPAPISTGTPVFVATSIPTSTPTVTPGGPRTLRIWVSPQFDPAVETPAATILQERLDEFVARRPGLQIEVRVKAESMLNALAATQAAAPSIAPDLLALSRADMEAAAAKGLLHPLDGLSTLPEDPDWYPYARQLSHIQNTAFGLPFAGDALALAGYAKPLPTSWSELPQGTLFIFPAAEPQASFTLSLYLSAGGTLIDDQGLPSIDETILSDTLSLYLPPEEGKGFLSPAIVDYQSSDQAWNALLEQRGNLAVIWTSNYLQNPPPLLTIAPLPGRDTGQYSLAEGWSWALAGSPENQPLAVELAEFLADSQFLAEWTQAAGYLPTRPTALSSWSDTKYKADLELVAESANLVPSADQLSQIGPLLTEATLAVIKGEQLPFPAAQAVTEQLK